MTKIKQPKIPIDIVTPEIITINWKLSKPNVPNSFSKFGEKISWIEWNDNGTFKEKHDEPAVGRSLIIDPHYMSYTWLTTTITEVLEQTEDKVVFNTQNSLYLLEKIGNNE